MPSMQGLSPNNMRASPLPMFTAMSCTSFRRSRAAFWTLERGRAVMRRRLPHAGMGLSRSNRRRSFAARGSVFILKPRPDLAAVRGLDDLYDVVMLTAVWMHLDEAERRIAIAHLAGLLAPHGQIILSLRHGPIPPGRRMFDVSAAETINLGASVGLSCVHHTEREDMLGRSDATWSFLGLKLGSREGA